MRSQVLNTRCRINKQSFQAGKKSVTWAHVFLHCARCSALTLTDNFAKSFLNFGILKGKAALEKLLGYDPLAIEENPAEFPEHGPNHKAGGL